MIDFWVAFSDVAIIVRRLVRKAGSATAGKPDLLVGHDLLTKALKGRWMLDLASTHQEDQR